VCAHIYNYIHFYIFFPFEETSVANISRSLLSRQWQSYTRTLVRVLHSHFGFVPAEVTSDHQNDSSEKSIIDAVAILDHNRLFI